MKGEHCTYSIVEMMTMNDDSSCILLSFVIAMMIVIIDSPWYLLSLNSPSTYMNWFRGR